MTTVPHAILITRSITQQLVSIHEVDIDHFISTFESRSASIQRCQGRLDKLSTLKIRDDTSLLLSKRKTTPKRSSSNAARNRGRSFGDDDTITVLVAENPKRHGAMNRERFSLYETGATVGAYLDAVVKKFGGPRARWRGDIAWDTDHGFIRVGA